jgi:hypothetical protein
MNRTLYNHTNKINFLTMMSSKFSLKDTRFHVEYRLYSGMHRMQMYLLYERNAVLVLICEMFPKPSILLCCRIK